MVRGVKKKDRQRTGMIWCVWCGCIVFCACFVAACGVPPMPAHPLTAADTPTSENTTLAPTGSAAHALPVRVAMAQSNLSSYPGGQMSMVIFTSPYALCSFIVEYGQPTPSHDVGIIPATADASGKATWQWRVDSTAHTGVWPLTISAVLPGGAKTSATVNVTVALPPINVVGAQSNLSSYPKGNMLLTIATAPGVACTLGLSYGPSRPVKYLASRSDFNGLASWSWHVDAGAPAGVWPSVVTVTLADGERASSQVDLTVQ